MSEVRFCERLAAYCEGQTFIDVGANAGSATYLLAPFAANVIAIEPNVELVERIQSECKKRGIEDRVAVLQCVASDKTGTASIYIGLNNNGLSSVFEDNLSLRPFFVADATPYEERLVESIAIDDLGLDNVGAIKIDVEGFEGNVVRGAIETIARCRPAIIWERSIKLARTTNDVVEALLGELGYTHTVINVANGVHDDVLSTPT